MSNSAKVSVEAKGTWKKKQMHEIVEAMPAYFFYDDEAPVKVRTVKDGIRSHEFYEDWYTDLFNTFKKPQEEKTSSFFKHISEKQTMGLRYEGQQGLAFDCCKRRT